MKVGIVTEKLDTDKITGHGRYIYELVKHLQRLENDKFKLKLIHFQQSNLEIYNDQNQIIIQKPKKGLRFIYPLLLRKFDLDVVHYPSQNISPLFWTSNSRIVVTIHGIDFAFSKIDRKRKNYTKYLQLFKKKIDYVISPTMEAAKCVQSYFNINNVVPIHHGIDRNIFYPVPNKENIKNHLKKEFDISGRYFLHVSTLKLDKNFYSVLLGFNKLIQDKYDVSLIVAGGTKNRICEYKDFIKRKFDKKLFDHVYFVKHINDDNLLRSFYNIAECLVNPSFESFGFPLVEAMACGCPVIYGNGYGAKSVVSDAGIGVSLIGRKKNREFNRLVGVIDRNNDNYLKVAKEIYEAMKKILDDKQYKNELVAKSIKRSMQFSWKKSAKDHLELYQKLYR